MSGTSPFVVAVAGLSSNVGKTTVACELLRRLPGWEAIKVTKGHYRSCGRDAEACCVSHLLRDEPVVRSQRHDTATAGKDTGRYWAAGAANVHWVIATAAQVGEGVREALRRVSPDSPGVVVEGTSFVETVPAGYVLLVGRADSRDVKRSAVRVAHSADILLVSRGGAEEALQLSQRLAERGAVVPPLATAADLDEVVREIRRRCHEAGGRRSRLSP
jgi:molybdopterin-guanine dinucleotide biosynthesis protein